MRTMQQDTMMADYISQCEGVKEAQGKKMT